MTKAALGTSPIASVPYTLSLAFPILTFGMFAIIFNLALIGLQWFIERENANRFQLIIQVIISFGFGSFIDLAMFFLTGFNPQIYIVKIFSLVCGCCILGIGTYFEIIADVAMLPADAFMRALSKVMHKEYGTVRIIFDVTMTIISAAIGIFATGALIGVREGTVIAAIITGQIVKAIVRLLKPLTEKIV